MPRDFARKPHRIAALYAGPIEIEHETQRAFLPLKMPDLRQQGRFADPADPADIGKAEFPARAVRKLPIDQLFKPGDLVVAPEDSALDQFDIRIDQCLGPGQAGTGGIEVLGGGRCCTSKGQPAHEPFQMIGRELRIGKGGCDALWAEIVFAQQCVAQIGFHFAEWRLHSPPCNQISQFASMVLKPPRTGRIAHDPLRVPKPGIAGVCQPRDDRNAQRRYIRAVLQLSKAGSRKRFLRLEKAGQGSITQRQIDGRRAAACLGQPAHHHLSGIGQASLRWRDLGIAHGAPPRSGGRIISSRFRSFAAIAGKSDRS